MSFLTEHYLKWLKVRKRGDNVRQFKIFMQTVFDEISATDMFVLSFYEIHKLNKRIGKLND